MKTSTLRDAICIALFTAAACAATPVIAQEEVAAEVGAEPEATTGQQPREEPDPQEGGLDGRSPAPDADPDPESEVTELASMTVTGTRIRGGTTPSPVIEITSEQIREEGFTDLGEVIRSVPQNFGGGQNPGVIGVAVGVANQDVTGGSSLNLRGLGPDASLTLINGRRLAYDGFSQAVDISAIPIEAVQRVEIIPDGASAIYGSDAVGGVANVILKPDFAGLGLSARYGRATGGGLGTHEYTATAGTQWESGGLIATFKDLTSDPIHVRQRTYTRHLTEPYTIYSGVDMQNGLVSGYQSIGDSVEIRLDAINSKREMTRYAPQGEDYLKYSPSSSVTLVAPSAHFYFDSGWALEFGSAYGKNEAIYENSLIIENESRLVTQTCYCNRTRSYEVGAEGPLASGGKGARLAAGAGERRQEFIYQPWISGLPYEGEDRVRFAYAELNFPFVSSSPEHNNRPRLEISAALRSEQYESFGQVTTPKLGLTYYINDGITFKTSWGKSFKAPTQMQRQLEKTAYLFHASTVGASNEPVDATALMSYGGNPDLRAEHARTWSASVLLHPRALHGFEAELTWFDIDYVDRVVEPVNYLQALSDPAYGDFVTFSPTRQEIEEVLASYDSAFYNLSGTPYDPDNVVAIIHNQYANVARQRVRGADVSISYGADFAEGRLTARVQGSWLDSKQRPSPAHPEHRMAGMIFNPARIRSRAGATWARGEFSAAAFLNYTGAVTNKMADEWEKTSSFTTLDISTSYNITSSISALSGLTVDLTVQNILDRDPPLHTPAVSTYVPYDATNYSAIGRFASVSIAKRWW